MELQTVTIFRNWVELAADLPSDKERGQFYHAVCQYALDGTEPELSGILKHYFTLIRPVLDKSAKRKKAQEKSVAKRKQADLQNDLQNDLQTELQNDAQTDLQADLQNELQNNSQSESLRVSIRVREKELPNGNSKKKNPIKLFPTFVEIIPEKLCTDAFKAKWQEWEHYRRNRKKPISEAAATKQLAMLVELSEAEAIAAIDQSIQNDYQGLFPPKGISPDNSKKQKDYTGV